MTTMKIEYKFNLSQFHNKEELAYVESGIRIIIDDIVVTKTLFFDDDGFVGDYLVHVFIGLVTAVPKLLSGCPHSSLFLDSPETIEFTPKNDFILIKFWYPENLWEDPDNEIDRGQLQEIKQFNGRYPNYPEGTPVPIHVLIDEIIRVCEDFLHFIDPDSTLKEPDIIDLRLELKKLKEFWKNKSKEYPENAGIT